MSLPMCLTELTGQATICTNHACKSLLREFTAKLGSIGIDSSNVGEINFGVELPWIVLSLDQASEMFEVGCNQVEQ